MDDRELILFARDMNGQQKAWGEATRAAERHRAYRPGWNASPACAPFHAKMADALTLIADAVLNDPKTQTDKDRLHDYRWFLEDIQICAPPGASRYDQCTSCADIPTRAQWLWDEVQQAKKK
jgi:hypothetical protein